MLDRRMMTCFACVSLGALILGTLTAEGESPSIQPLS